MDTKNFSEQLHSIMKENKISGQRLADIVGVSQKTISRYYRGESIPDKQMQRAIISAIGLLCLEQENSLKFERHCISLRKLVDEKQLIQKDFDETTDLQEEYQNLECACKIFSLLEDENRNYMLQYLDVFCDININDWIMLEYFNCLSKSDKLALTEDLQHVILNIALLQKNKSIRKKISTYLIMEDACEICKKEDTSKFSFTDLTYTKTEMVCEFKKRLKEMNGLTIAVFANILPEMISLKPEDWHFLVLLQCLRLNDRGMNYGYSGTLIGDKMYGLMEYLKHLKKRTGNTL